MASSLKGFSKIGNFILSKIIELFLRRGNYKELETNHSYIQWLFPNFYKSAFNSDASPLTEDEAEIFRSNKEVNNS